MNGTWFLCFVPYASLLYICSFQNIVRPVMQSFKLRKWTLSPRVQFVDPTKRPLPQVGLLYIGEAARQPPLWAVAMHGYSEIQFATLNRSKPLKWWNPTSAELTASSVSLDRRVNLFQIDQIVTPANIGTVIGFSSFFLPASAWPTPYHWYSINCKPRDAIQACISSHMDWTTQCWGGLGFAVYRISRHRLNWSQRLIWQNPHLSEMHNVNYNILGSGSSKAQTFLKKSAPRA